VAYELVKDGVLVTFHPPVTVDLDAYSVLCALEADVVVLGWSGWKFVSSMSLISL
jgi:sorbitol-specific phosphotransferase system component IIA